MSAVRIGLLGGSFDPIHKGHLALAKAILKDGCSQVWLIPCMISPFKHEKPTSFEDRVAMIKRAIAPFKKMKVCTIEKELPMPSYTIHTLQKLKEKYDHEFIFYIGNDQAQLLDKWKDIEECMKLAEFRVFKRDSEMIECPYDLKEVPFERIDISSTKVREGAFQDVSESVRNYIWEHRLYLHEFAQHSMNEKRYRHSVSVANVCKELASAHHLNEEDAYVIGLLHDICKCWDDEKSERFMKVYEKDHLDEPKAIWHGYLADHYLKRVFKIKEKHILKAVHHHVKGDCDDPYAQIVYIADKCEPLRGYDSSYELNLAKRNLKEAVYYVKQVQSEYIKKEKQV